MTWLRRARTAALACACALQAAAALGATVRVTVVDDATGREVAARFYLRRGEQTLLPPGFPTYARGEERHFLASGSFELQLEPGPHRLRVERGLEYLPAEVELDPARAPAAEVRLRRWAHMNRDRWYSADMHVHRDPAEVPLILRAEDLNFVPTITTHVWSNDVNRPWSPAAATAVVVEPGRFFTANAQEVERIQGGPGAVILLAKQLPLPFDGYELYPPTVAYTRQVHAAGGWVEGDKPFWLDTFVNAALGELDFMEVNCNHFPPRLVETDLSPWSHWPLELGFLGQRGFALWVMDLYYRMLNSGIELPLSAGSAAGVKATPVGYDRVYVRPGDGPVDHPAFMRALKQGRSFSTNGPLLEVELDGGHGPGDRVAVRPGEPHRLRARARWRGELEVLQLIVDGEVVGERRADGARELALEQQLRCQRSCWVAARVFAPSGAGEVFAHTSPVYLLVDGRPVVVPRSVRDLLEKTDRLIEHTRRLPGFRQESHRQETLEVYRQARAVLERRLLAP